MKKNGFYYALGLLFFVALKIAYTQMDANDLIFILRPTDQIISFLTNSKGIFLTGAGYFHEDLNILIEKSCSGFNFFSLSFLIGYFVSVNHFHHKKHKWLALALSLLAAWMLTLFVNASRIIVAIFLKKLAIPLPGADKWLHQAEGTFVYLFFLILFYKTLNYLLTQYFPKNEKFA
ncbi:Transmembrane exosortase [compost metagenome]